jgi:zeta-carotene desaturase
MASLILLPANSVSGTRSKTAPPGFLFSGGRRAVAQVRFRNRRLFTVRSALDSLETKVSDMSVNGNSLKFPFFALIVLLALTFCAFRLSGFFFLD